MKNYILKIVLMLNFILVSMFSWAFPGNPDGSEDPPFDDGVPIDTYLWLLIPTAIMYGFYLIHKKQKKEFAK